jgi:hypothetical protein
MPLFRVTLYNNAVMDINNKNIEREAENEKEAAEMVSGETLSERGKPSQYRAEVRPLSSITQVKSFYSQSKQIFY